MKNIYNGKILKLTEQEINGHIYEKVFIKNAVTVIPITKNKEVLLIKENRPQENPKVRWKFVTGFLESNESVKENANREMQEEIGKKALELELFCVYESTGTLNIKQHIYIAQNLIDQSLPNPDHDTVLEIKAFPFKTIIPEILAGKILKGNSALVFLQWLHQNNHLKIDFFV